MPYDFLIQTYQTEVDKVLGAWAMFDDGDLAVRPHESDARGRSLHEQMVHQCLSEDHWFANILGVDVAPEPLPEDETRVEFMHQYANAAFRRLDALRGKDEAWWEETVDFFGVPRSRAWVMVRRIAHTAHHRGQQTALLRMINRDLHSTYGPTADTGGLMQDRAPTIYAYEDADTLLSEERASRNKAALPGAGSRPVTERSSR